MSGLHLLLSRRALMPLAPTKSQPSSSSSLCWVVSPLHSPLSAEAAAGMGKTLPSRSGTVRHGLLAPAFASLPTASTFFAIDLSFSLFLLSPASARFFACRAYSFVFVLFTSSASSPLSDGLPDVCMLCGLVTTSFFSFFSSSVFCRSIVRGIRSFSCVWRVFSPPACPERGFSSNKRPLKLAGVKRKETFHFSFCT